MLLLLLLAVAAVVYSRCHLNIKLWYRNSYGEYELNGKIPQNRYKVDCGLCAVGLTVFVSLCLQMANCMTPTSPT